MEGHDFDTIAATVIQVQALQAAGVEFLSEPVAMGPGVRFCCFRDPDGMVLELIDFSGSKG